jgi:transcription-repair coupling factor (superfamily II helicase)
MRDMEIRGAGNLLGRQQSGHIAAVGLDLYLEMMEKTVKTLRGECVEEEIDPTLNLQISAFIPEAYIPDSGQRLSLYKRIAGSRDEAEIVSIKEEMQDRFGTSPEEVGTLLEVIRLKLLCRKAGVVKIDRDQERLFLTLNPKKALGEAAVSRLLSLYPGHIRFLSEFTFQIRISSQWPEAFIEIKNCLQEIVGYALMR